MSNKETDHAELTKENGVSRRQFLKGTAFTGAMMTLPGIVGAKLTYINPETTQGLIAGPIDADLGGNVLADGGLSIEFSDAGASNIDTDLVRVSVTNLTDKSIALIKVSPGSITLGGKHYDLNERLSHCPLTIQAGRVHHEWLHPSMLRSSGSVAANNHATHGGMIVLDVVQGRPGTLQRRQRQLAHVALA